MPVFLYDLDKCPASWDFLQWLVNAEIIHTNNGARAGELKLAFKPGSKDGFRDDGLARPLDQRRAIFDNVMHPAIKMMEVTEVPYDPNEQYFTDVPYLTRFTVDHCLNNGGDIPYFREPMAVVGEVKSYLNGRKPVVITLREASYYPSRNSNIEAWTAWARESGEDVIFVRDTAKADEPLPGFETCPRASQDLYFRTILMRLARCNLMVSNGPWILTLYSPSPWLCFGQLHPEIPDWRPGRPEWWNHQMGVPEGGQFPWSHPNQRLIWRDDSLESIRDAWAQYKDVIDDPPAYKIGEIKTKGVWSDEDRLANCLRNMGLIKQRVPELPPHDGVAIIACYGPSLQDTYKVMRHQRNHVPKCTLVSVSGAHDFLVANRLRPNIHIECDPRPHKALMLNNPQRKTKYLLASCVHPDMTAKLENYDVSLWHLLSGGASMDLFKHEPDAILTAGGGSVGLRAICVMYQLGYRRFLIHGMDCSFRAEKQHAAEHTGKKQHPRRVRVGAKWYDTASIQVAYARQFLEMVDKMNQVAQQTNQPPCIFGLHGDGMLQEMCRQAMQAGGVEAEAA
jgi:hypothetical protein